MGSSAYLLFQWVRRDFRVRYTQTLLGSLWALVQPIALTATFVFLFDGVANLDVGAPYPLFAFIGMLLWGLVSNGLTLAAAATANSLYIASKANYPRIVAPLSAVLLAVVDLAISAVLLPVLVVQQHASLHFAPVPLLAALFGAVLLTVGLGCILSALAIFVRDVKTATPFFLQVAVLLTPVAYNEAQVPDALRPFATWNPAGVYVQGFRGSLLDLPTPSAAAWISAALVTGAVLVLGVWYYQTVQSRFPDVA